MKRRQQTLDMCSRYRFWVFDIQREFQRQGAERAINAYADSLTAWRFGDAARWCEHPRRVAP